MRKQIVLLTLIAPFVLLSGCASFTNSKITQVCAKAPYVYSNLQVQKGQRTYHLPTGQSCPTPHRGFFG